MKNVIRWSVALAVVGGLGTLVTGVVSAQNTGDTVTLLIPTASNQPEPASGPSDKLIITGGKVTSTDIAGCGTGSHPVQNAILVDPGAARSSRIVGIIVVSQTDPVPPGTKLKSLSFDAACTVSGTPYNRYNGTVE